MVVSHTHDLRSVGQRVRLLPSVPGATTLDGVKLEHVMLCVGHYDESLEVRSCRSCEQRARPGHPAWRSTLLQP